MEFSPVTLRVISPCDPPGPVHAQTATNGLHRQLHFYFNYSGSEVNFAYPHKAGSELLGERRIAPQQQITLPPWDVAIVEEGAD